MDNPSTQKPLITNPYPDMQQPYSPQNYNGGNQYANYQNQGFKVQSYPQNVQNNQQFMPQYTNQPIVPPPPVQNQQTVLVMPAFATAHPRYRFIVQQAGLPCAVCSYRGTDMITMTPGCTAFSWSIVLYILTGILCFWIPFVCQSCKDIKISCSRCHHTKCIIEKSCC